MVHWKPIVAAPTACFIFILPIICILLPILLHLEPTTLQKADNWAAHIGSYFTSTNTPSSVPPSTAATTPDATNAAPINGVPQSRLQRSTTSTVPPKTPPTFVAGQVFTHARIRYQGVITKILTNKDKRRLKLKPLTDTWYNALVDSRYKPGGVSDNVNGKDIKLIYPAESNFKHPKLNTYFASFDADTFSFKLKKTKEEKFMDKKQKQQQRDTRKKKKVRRKTKNRN
jgi:hypothetical protein